MRTAIVALLALVAVAAAGLWGLAQFGAPKPMVAEEHAPVAKVNAVSSAGVAGAGATAPLAPAQHEPGAAHPNAADDLKTEKPQADRKADAKVAAAAPAPSPVVTPAPAPPPPAAATPSVTTTTTATPEATTTTTATAAEANPTDPLKAAARKMQQKLKTAGAPAAAPTPAPTLAPGFAPTPSPASTPPPPPAATPAPPPAATPAPAPAAAPSPDLVQTASAPSAATAAAAPASLADQFKTRKVAYNRPPTTLYLDRPIDISLVIDATAAADPAAQLQGFPGQVVERDVSLSDTVSARLTGVGFDITSQNPGAERQALSAHTPNRWQWRVTPTEPGTHTLMLDIFGYKTGSLDAEPLDAYSDKITVQVQQLDSVIKWAKGIQPLFAVIAAIAGLLSALIAFLRFRRDGKKSS